MNAVNVIAGLVFSALVGNAIWNAAEYIATHRRRNTP